MNRRLLGVGATVAALIAVIVIAVVAGGGGGSGGGDKKVVTVHGLIGSEKAPYFADPTVKAAFKKAGYDVQVDTAGSVQQLKADKTKYDFFFPGSAPVAEELKGRIPGSKTFATFYTPLVIYTFKDIADLLQRNHIVDRSTFDVQKYEALVRAGTRWNALDGNKNGEVYKTSKVALATTTNPASSNSALMFASLTAYVANGGAVVNSPAAVKKVAPLINPLFNDQGYKESSSEGPFLDYLSSIGKGKVPLLVGYESQLLALQIAHDQQVTGDMTVLYPSPGLVTKHTLVSRTEAGAAIGALLLNDAALVKAQATYGFRTPNAGVFNQVLSSAGVSPPPASADFVDPSAWPYLAALVCAIDPTSCVALGADPSAEPTATPSS